MCCAAFFNKSYCISLRARICSKVLFHRMSGCRRSVPNPEHGASISTASAVLINPISSFITSITRVSTLWTPTRRQFFCNNATFSVDTSIAMSLPAFPMRWARCVVLPPGAAQRSTMNRASWGERRCDTNIALSSWT